MFSLQGMLKKPVSGVRAHVLHVGSARQNGCALLDGPFGKTHRACFFEYSLQLMLFVSS